MYDAIKSIPHKIKYMREAAAVKRCHTVPIVGEYNVGYHSFNMLAMLRIIYPDAPVRLVWAIIEHDAPERLTGDHPAPAKWFGIVDKSGLKMAEHEIMISVLGEDTVNSLPKEEVKIMAALDIFELLLFCRDQIMLGNKNLLRMIHRINNFIAHNGDLFDPKVLDIIHETSRIPWVMLPDLGELEPETIWEFEE